MKGLPTRWPHAEPQPDKKFAALVRRTQLISRNRFANAFVRNSTQGFYKPGTPISPPKRSTK